MRNKEHKILFIGTGYIANIHAKTIKKLVEEGKINTRIVGCLTTSRKKGESFCKKFGGTPYGKLKDVLNQNKPSIVYICTPPFIKGDIESELGRNNINIFLEKPVAINNEQVVKLKKINKLNCNILIHVGFVWRFAGWVKQLMDIIKKEKGRIVINGYRFSKFIDSNKWSYKREKSGGFLVEQNIHLIDIFNYLNSFKKLNIINSTILKSQQVKHIKKKANIEDGGNVILKSKNKIFNLIFTTFSSAYYESGIELISENFFGKIILNNEGYFVSKIFDSFGVIYKNKEHISDLYKEQTLTFIKSIEDGSQLDVIPLSQGIKTSELCLAIYKNSKII